MNPADSAPAPETLLAHARWVRTLARSLVLDEARAQDLEQEVWLAALERPPAHAANLRAWFSSALRNAARATGRAETRRRDREERAARPELEPSSEEVLERARLHRDLVDRVLGLEPASREVLLLRYFEELEPAEIAKRLGLPASTVRSRLARALERLRDKLEREHGGCEAWCAALAPLAWPPLGGAGLPVTPTPTLGVPIAMTIAATACLCTLALFGPGLFESQPPAAPEPIPPPAPPDREPIEPAPPPAELPVATPLENLVEVDHPPEILPEAPAFAPEKSAHVADLAPWDDLARPPGLVFIEGGATWIGTDPEDIAAIIARNNFRKLVGETPRHRIDVEDYFLMVTEVTVEQYAAYVAATGAKPPQSWGNAAIDAGALVFAEEEGKRIQELREAGKPIARRKFDRARWWEDNWRESAFELPSDRLTHPTEYVSYDDVLGYCRWAGLRPMTEVEFQRAGRGDTTRIFPWGDDFGEDRAATFEAGTMDCWPVGSFESGVTEQGVHDLIGNVWEWTSSAYLAYPKYKPIDVEFDSRRKETCFTDFDGSQRVVVGGGFPNDKDACRLSVRRATNQSQATQAMGFRCAASVRPGLDLSDSVLRFDVPTYVIPEGVRHQPQFAIGMDRWSTATGTCQVEGYQLISGYDHFLFIPVESIDSSSIVELTAQSHKQPVHLGVLSLSVKIDSPALDPGVYLVGWRAEGEGAATDEGQGEEVAADAEPPIWSLEEDQLIFYDLTGNPVLATKARSLDFKRLKPGGVLPRTVEPSEEQKQAGIQPFEELRLQVPLPAKGGAKGFELDLRLRMPVGSLGEGWRRTQ